MLANPNLKSQFYDHPIIRGLTAKKRKVPSFVPARFYNHPLVRGFTQEKRRLPSYIPSQQFALSLFDIAVTAGTESSLIQQGILKIRDDLNNKNRLSKDYAAIEALNVLADLARSAAATEAGTAVTQKTLDILKLEAERFAEKYPAYRKDIEAALEEARKYKDEIEEVLKKQPKDDDPALNKLRRGIAAMSVISPEVSQSLNALLLNIEEFTQQGETHIAKARRNVEKWFDDSMERVSGVFKRESQTMALIIGFIIALVLNVDSINLTYYLWRDTSVRQTLVQNAMQFELSEAEFDRDPEQAMAELRRKFIGLSLPVGWVINDSTPPSIQDIKCRSLPGQFEAFGVRIPFTQKCLAPPQADNTTNIFLKLGGIFITALAARQGAPFWFDFLKRFVNLRGTGANPVEKEGK
jgi:hypothetical protein